MSLSVNSEHELLSHLIGPVRRFGVRKCKRRFLQGGLDPAEVEPGLDLFRRIYLKFYDHILYLLLVGKLQKVGCRNVSCFIVSLIRALHELT